MIFSYVCPLESLSDNERHGQRENEWDQAVERVLEECSVEPEPDLERGQEEQVGLVEG